VLSWSCPFVKEGRGLARDRASHNRANAQVAS